MKDKDNILGKKLAEIRKSKGLTQDDVADMLEVKRQTYSAYERGLSSPDSPVLAKIARLFGVTTDSILYDDIDMDDYRNHVPHIRIPVYNTIKYNIPPDENISYYEEVEISIGPQETLFGLKIRDKEMEPRLSVGDTVIVKIQDDAESNDICVISVGESDSVVRKIKKHTDGISFIPSNPAFEPVFYSKSDINELPVRIIGRVAELRAKF